MDSKICYIFGAGEQSSCDIRLSGSDLVIAADGGFDYLKKLGLRADIVLGDFDSLSDSQNLPEDFIRYPKEKDDTDMMIAIKEGLARGYRTFRIYGGLGGRLDHTIANLQRGLSSYGYQRRNPFFCQRFTGKRSRQSLLRLFPQ